ncbi:competence type IV pilus minor pilin ComGG [Metabacillus halosaccharovorans]|uniref:Competence type IV pilus minor pilin ComGG n=1 Tax=Metabacillus halosaccharovorans TaxID=930124 RepID=A0ABT3DCP2_9BACI|nr:competence type IV pilus minor pilin ComGG [Metabacillus halosaccharovorans]MCV9884824.1 competence type IV pilus minor pilin ComGG [Metabacillus halosaccharovorans]
MRNQKGFILPSIMVIALFCLLIVAHISTILISEKTFYEETKQYYILENLMNVAVKKSLHELENGNNVNQHNKVFHTSNGYYSYNVTTSDEVIYEVQLTCSTKETKEYTASYKYDKSKNEMIFWSEY